MFFEYQTGEIKYPTVVPVVNFDPDKDAARIETAIKTKGKEIEKSYTVFPYLQMRNFWMSHIFPSNLETALYLFLTVLAFQP